MQSSDPKMIFEGEHIVYRAGYHWIHVLRAFVPMVLVIVAGSIIWSYVPTPWTSLLVFISLIASIVWIVIKVVETIIKKAYVTNRRLIYRVGWTSRDVIDVTLDRIGGVIMEQDYWQRFLGYGTVQVLVPIVEIKLPRYLRNPVEFRNALYIKKAEAEKPDDDDEVLAEEAGRLNKERDEDKDEIETAPLSSIETADEDNFGIDTHREDYGVDAGIDTHQEEYGIDTGDTDTSSVTDSGDDGSSHS